MARKPRLTRAMLVVMQEALRSRMAGGGPQEEIGEEGDESPEDVFLMRAWREGAADRAMDWLLAEMDRRAARKRKTP